MSADVVEMIEEQRDTERKGGRMEARPFPRKTLTDAIKVVHAIKDNNAGKPYAPPQIADAIGRKPRSSDFQVILSAAQYYGITDGNTRASTVSLTPLGQKIAYPKDPEDEKDGHFQAFNNVEIFNKVYLHYENNKVPEVKFFRNTLISEFKLHESYVDEFIDIFDGNLRFLGVNMREIVSFKPVKEIQEQISKDVSRPNASVVKSGRHRAFVIMPFVERNVARQEGFFKEVYRSLIEPAAKAAGFDVDWANKTGSDVIQSTIINEVLDCDLLIADLTDHNPNVLFELGLRLAHNQGPTALIKTQDTGRLFDVDNLVRVYEYKQTLWRTSLEIDVPNLEEHIRATWENRDKNESYLNILRKRREI